MIVDSTFLFCTDLNQWFRQAKAMTRQAKVTNEANVLILFQNNQGFSKVALIFCTDSSDAFEISNSSI